MKTKLWTVENAVDGLESYPQLKAAARELRKSETVAFPTETVYGLGGNAQSDQAVEKIFAAKGRPADNPLIVHISSKTQLKELVENIPPHAERLMEAFWPGPLTLIFHSKQGSVSKLVTAGLETVAVRMPDHPVALALLAATNLPIAAPSANRSGKPSPTTADHVRDDLDGRIAGILDGGATGVGVESTVLDCTSPIPAILRPGGISKSEIESVIGKVAVDNDELNQKDIPKAPGMKYRHYAPSASLYIVKGERQWIQEQISEMRQKGLKVGIMAPVEHIHFYQADYVLACGSLSRLSSVAQELYQTLRAFDKEELDIIFSEEFPQTDVGAAVMNRLDKAAGHKWLIQAKSK